MAATFTISAAFLTGRYHGEEWPPSPARLMQALVCAAKSGGQRGQWESVSEGLRWLERQTPPIMRARQQTPLKTCRVAVPNNDMDSPARDWLAGRWNDGSSIKTMKDIAPKLVGDGFPHVEYEWEMEDTTEVLQRAEQLMPAVHGLYSLGWGVDITFADIRIGNGPVDKPGWKQYVPADRGDIYKVPVPGFLDDLEETFSKYVSRSSGVGVDTSTRPTVYRDQRYRELGRSYPPSATFGLRTTDAEEIFSRPWSHAMEISAWMRHSAGILLSGFVPAEVLEAEVYGHSDQTKDSNRRLSYVPLPSIHAQHGDGRIRRVMITEARDSQGSLVKRLQERWNGAALSHEGLDRCVMTEQRDGVTNLYTGSSRSWSSVTPVILHGHNSQRGVISVTKTEKLILRAFEMAGLDEATIKSLSFQPAPFWNGTGSAIQMRVPRHLEGYPRYHIRVDFRSDVYGPVLAGIGRHYGIGLFART